MIYAIIKRNKLRELDEVISQRPLCPGGLQLYGNDRGVEAGLRHRINDAHELGHLVWTLMWKGGLPG